MKAAAIVLAAAFLAGTASPARAQLGGLGKIKSMAHGRKTAYTPNADACRACGLCVVACPEKAIALRAR